MSCKVLISSVSPADYPEMTEVWEASVRATHHFLSNEYIEILKPLVRDEYLRLVKLNCIKDDEGKIIGFSGVADDKLEMLFIHPDTRGKGIGKMLLLHTINELNVKKVDVNEQNEQGLGFYQHLGFKVKGRSETDALGQPYPLLHMELG